MRKGYVRQGQEAPRFRRLMMTKPWISSVSRDTVSIPRDGAWKTVPGKGPNRGKLPGHPGDPAPA